MPSRCATWMMPEIPGIFADVRIARAALSNEFNPNTSSAALHRLTRAVLRAGQRLDGSQK